MKIITFIFALTLICTSLSAKEPEPEKVLEEGKLLSRLEKASWYATDDFMVRFPHKKESAGGYVSYVADNHVYTAFFDKDDPAKLLVRYKFYIDPAPRPVAADTLDIAATDRESDLKTIKDETAKLVPYTCNSYENTGFNFIPLIAGGEKKVYVLTAPHQHGVVLIGNDYLFRFDDKNKYKDMKRLHKSLIQIPYKSEDAANPIEKTFHSHVVSDIIDPTDICTLLLYRGYVEWTEHYVLGKKYVSIFDMENEKLEIVPRKEWDKQKKEAEKELKKKK